MCPTSEKYVKIPQCLKLILNCNKRIEPRSHIEKRKRIQLKDIFPFRRNIKIFYLRLRFVEESSTHSQTP